MVQHGRTPGIRRSAALAAALLLGLLSAARAEPAFTDPWPAVGDAAGRIVAVPSHSPFVPSEIGPEAPSTPARVTYYPPTGADATRKAPAVVLLHGAAGIDENREPTYARQLAAMGIGAAVVDVFGARRDLATSFTDRVIEITETMALADAYATLAWLKARPEIDGSRVAVWGFSYGAMASIVATNAAIADRFAALYRLGDTRFAAHVAFYGPCIIGFEEPRTTGAPVLMAWGDRDAIMDPADCQTTAATLRQGGSQVRTITYPGAVHQWDGSRPGPRPIGRLLNDCDFQVERDLTVRDGNLGIAMGGSFTRKLILANCVGSEGYLIGRDDAVRAGSDRDVAAFLSAAFGLAKRS
ncbi:dienelactone hydrolase family protein [Inquilinus sp. YAF38]|uniref:dienelactone hydrolase family protein n=1 Tax=Inquilinus sp. YAF38 TaxID=3233084 RepID=UPI003F909250